MPLEHEEPTFLQQRAEILTFALTQYLETIVRHCPQVLSSPAFEMFLGDLETFCEQVVSIQPLLGSSALLINIREMQKQLGIPLKESYGD